MDYRSIQLQAASLLREYGKPAAFSRAGLPIGTCSCLQQSSDAADDATSAFAQTAQARLRIMCSPLSQAVQAGDTVVIEEHTFTVAKVQEVRPATVTLAFYVEVV